jgi:tRNA nucleotidyltransferase/poly(A) polymerase
MHLSELLYAIGKIAEDKGLSTPYIVGGLVRDRLLNKAAIINDVDITTGDAGIRSLAIEMASRLRDQASYIVFPDGHSSLQIDELKLDFSSNFKILGIVDMLKKGGISNPTEMQKELYSRDFTCNIALMTLDLKTIMDPSGLAVSDIKSKIIKTCLDPDITLGYDNKRIIRAVYLSAKLDFDIASEIINWVRKRPELVNNITAQYITKKVNKALGYNKDRTIEALSVMKLWPHIPPTKELIPYMDHKRM